MHIFLSQRQCLENKAKCSLTSGSQRGCYQRCDMQSRVISGARNKADRGRSMGQLTERGWTLPSGQLSIQQQKLFIPSRGQSGHFMKLGTEPVWLLSEANWPSPRPVRVKVPVLLEYVCDMRHNLKLNNSGITFLRLHHWLLIPNR